MKLFSLLVVYLRYWKTMSGMNYSVKNYRKRFGAKAIKGGASWNRGNPKIDFEWKSLNPKGSTVPHAVGTRALAKAVKRIEMKSLTKKYFITTANTMSGASSNVIYTWNPLGNIAVGTGETNRLGDSIHVKNIRLRGVISTIPLQAAAANTFPNNTYFCRMIWVRHQKQVVGGSNVFAVSGLADSDIFVQGTSITGNSLTPITGLIDHDRVTVLADKVIKIQPQIQTNTPGNSQYVEGVTDVNYEFDFPAPDFPFTYQATGSSNYSSKNKQVYCLVMFGQTGNTSAPAPNMYYDGCVEYVDGTL